MAPPLSPPILTNRHLSREQCFGWLFLLLTINASVTLAADAIKDSGIVSAALNLFNISAILWLAAAAGLALLIASPNDKEAAALNRFDPWIIAGGIIVALCPVPPLSAAAATAVMLWLITTSTAGTRLRRGALIFGSITTSLLWGRVILALGGDQLLALDGWLAGKFAGTDGYANVIEFAGSDEVFVVAPGCSSLQGLSLAVVLWVTATQYLQIPLKWRTWMLLAVLLVVAVTINVIRMGSMAIWPAHFDSLHTGIGAAMFGWTTLIMMVGILYAWLGNAVSPRR